MLASLALLALVPHLVSSSPTPDSHLEKRAPAVYLSLEGQTGQCLGLYEGTEPADGVPVQNAPCGLTHSSWEIVKGDNQVVRFAGTNFCLDAGINPSDNGPLKLWTCLPGVPQQRWYYTDDNHIAITGGQVCVDYTAGGCSRPGCRPGTKNCASGYYQTWYATPAGTNPNPPVGGKQVHPNGDQSKCLTLEGNTAANGVVVKVAPCTAGNNGQRWDLNRGSGQVRLYGSNFCLDAGTNPANGVGMKVWTCYNNLSQQTWYYTDDNHIAITGGTQCLDVRKEDGTSLQTWTCSGNNPQQVFTT